MDNKEETTSALPHSQALVACSMEYVLKSWAPGNEASSLGTRPAAWERGQRPGNEASGLGARPAGALYSYCTVCHTLSFLLLCCTDKLADGSSVEQNQGMGIGLESQEPT